LGIRWQKTLLFLLAESIVPVSTAFETSIASDHFYFVAE